MSYMVAVEYEGTVPVKVDGKVIKASFKRGWKKAQATPYWQVITSPHTFTNPFSGVSVELNPLESTIYNWCMAWYSRYERGKETGAPTQAYDDMKYFLLELNREAYYDLID